MAVTAGGLVKQSVQLRSDQWDWLRALAAKDGQASVAAAVRKVVDAAIAAAEQQTGAAR